MLLHQLPLYLSQNLKKIVLLCTLPILLFSSARAQSCFTELADFSGFDTELYQTELENSACKLRDSFPTEFSNDFQVFDFGFYSLSEAMDGGYNIKWEEAKVRAANLSPYYLLFGKITSSKGVYTDFLIDLKLPTENIFSCLDQINGNLRNNLIQKYEALANITHESNGKSPYSYQLAEIQVMNQLSEYIGILKECCNWENKSLSSCSSCIYSPSEYNWMLNNNNMQKIPVEFVIDQTDIGMDEEDIGYTVESLGFSIDLDNEMNSMKQAVNEKFPNTSIKIYPCNYEQGCSNFKDIKSSFLSSNFDIGILIGVVQNEDGTGVVWWQMISNDDVLEIPEPTTHDSDTCYFFNSDKLYTHEEYCTNGIRPRGIIKDLEGLGFDYEFRFADPVSTPRVLTTEPLIDGEFQFSEVGDEPLLNKIMIMDKNQILIQLGEMIPDSGGNIQSGALDAHFFAPWSLLMGSNGFDGPFDYSTKNFFLDRENFIFITDDGENVVGHDYRNMGNFLWGAATYVMGLPSFIALTGAHANNLWNEPGWNIDSPDDQYSIKLGRYYAKKKNWRSIISNGRGNIFKN